ncbi:hypothetical protein M5689_016337 [Euphorbia peplus]|nr:hypothetical protein M5689_016337 [Euphorbia peplus]
MAIQEQFVQDSFGFELMDSCFDFQQSQQQQNVYFLQEMTCNFEQHCNKGTRTTYEASTSSCCSTSFDALFPQFLDAQHLEMQRQELDFFLQSQAERLKCGLQEQANKQMSFLLKRVESEAMQLMHQKEQEISQAKNKSMELESCIKRAQKESDSWQILAKENEEIAINLSKKLKQLTTQNCQDSESICCGSCQPNDATEDERGHQNDVVEGPKKMVCRGCNYRAPSLILLPCRHLCSCKFCEPFLISCPVCGSFKEGSLEVFWA